MRDIFDPQDLWIGAPPLAFSNSDKRPVTLDDNVSVALDSGPISIDVLANDFDPEGQALSLSSASAALGTAQAEADNTVTYTPPPGISGFDTVVYLVTDVLGQQSSGQINVTILEPQLSIETTPVNTLVVHSETGLIDITITDPAAFAGAYQVDTNALLSGPVNLVPPTITGTVAVGETLTASQGLWVYDLSAGAPVQSWQWQRAGSAIAGATQTTYVVQSGDIGTGVSVLEIQNDTSGQRFAQSNGLGTSYQPSDDSALIGWWDADDAATLTASGGFVSNWSNKAGGAAATQSSGPDRPATGTRTLNGRNVLDFDGSQMMESALAAPASGDIAFHVALVLDEVDNAFAAVLAVDGTNDFQIDANNGSQFDGRLNATGIGSAVSLSGGPFAGAMILSAVFDRTGAGTAEIYIGNTARGQTGYTQSIDPSVVMTFMGNRSQNASIDGAIAEVIVTGDVSNRVLHHTYLADKWGLT